MFALGESITQGRPPIDLFYFVKLGGWTYQQRLRHWFRMQFNKTVSLETFAGTGMGMCNIAETKLDDTTYGRTYRSKIQDPELDLLLIQTGNADMVMKGDERMLAKCAEDILSGVKATVIFLNFINEKWNSSRSLFYEEYNVSYVDVVNHTNFDGMHPNNESMSDMVAGLKHLIHLGIQERHNSPRIYHQQNENLNTFGHENMKHVVTTTKEMITSRNFSECESIWAHFCPGNFYKISIIEVQ